MKTNIKKIFSSLTLGLFTLSLLPLNLNTTNANSKLVYPLKKISKLECRFNEFNTLGSECLEDLPILKTSDYKKYATQNGGYNKFTRLYTVLWGASYKYGWDVGYGGHMGVDIATARGTPVYSMADGEVINAKYGAAEGKVVSIRHNINGQTIVSNYFHLNDYNVSKGDTIKAGEQIGTVGSTGNSTGNHLHFQIDTLTTFSPIYYNRATCPYSYYEITEKGHCFDELERITVDPLLFLETNGGILNNGNHTNKVAIKTNNQNKTTKNNINTTTNNKNTNKDLSIFEKGVFIGSDYGDVREVQSIYKALGYYKGEISGDYNDVLESVIKYQLDKNIISERGEAGTGNFGPKTRAQTKKDYTAYINNGGKKITTIITNDNKVTNKDKKSETTENDLELANDNRVSVGGNSKSRTEKISRENLMTREELEAKEVDDFLKDYNINLEFENAGGNVILGGTETLHLSITNRRNKYFRGTMPGGMTFEVDKGSLNIFPEKLFYFTDGKREIKITGLKEGTTKLKIKVGNVTVKTFNINIFNGQKNITPDSIQIIEQETFLGDTKTGLGILKQGNKALTNIEFSGTYKLKASDGNLVCLKKGELKDLKYLYKKNCDENEFKNEITFSYKDTVGGILIFNYKALNKNVKFDITNVSGKSLGSKNIVIQNEKSKSTNYAYINGEITKNL